MEAYGLKTAEYPIVAEEGKSAFFTPQPPTRASRLTYTQREGVHQQLSLTHVGPTGAPLQLQQGFEKNG